MIIAIRASKDVLATSSGKRRRTFRALGKPHTLEFGNDAIYLEVSEVPVELAQDPHLRFKEVNEEAMRAAGGSLTLLSSPPDNEPDAPDIGGGLTPPEEEGRVEPDPLARPTTAPCPPHDDDQSGELLERLAAAELDRDQYKAGLEEAVAELNRQSGKHQAELAAARPTSDLKSEMVQEAAPASARRPASTSALRGKKGRK